MNATTNTQVINTLEELFELLKDFLIEDTMPISNLCEAIGFSESTYYNWTNDITTKPRLDTLGKVFVYYELRAAILVSFDTNISFE